MRRCERQHRPIAEICIIPRKLLRPPYPIKKFHFTTFLWMWGLRWSKIIIILQLVTTGGLCSQSCGGVLVEQVIPKVQAFWKLARRSPWPLLTLRGNTLPFYRSSKGVCPTGYISFPRLRVPRAWSVCVLSLRSQFVLSLRWFSRSSLGVQVGISHGSLTLRVNFSTSSRLRCA